MRPNVVCLKFYFLTVYVRNLPTAKEETPSKDWLKPSVAFLVHTVEAQNWTPCFRVSLCPPAGVLALHSLCSSVCQPRPPFIPSPGGSSSCEISHVSTVPSCSSSCGIIKERKFVFVFYGNISRAP